MTNLPSSGKLPIEFLAACFQNPTNSYKFYWFLSILEHIKIGDSQNDNCPHCNPSIDDELVTESATAYTILKVREMPNIDALITSKRHVKDYFELSQH